MECGTSWGLIVTMGLAHSPEWRPGRRSQSTKARPQTPEPVDPDER